MEYNKNQRNEKYGRMNKKTQRTDGKITFVIRVTEDKKSLGKKQYLES